MNLCTFVSMYSTISQQSVANVQIMMYHSALLNIDQKMILKDALFLYVSDLQGRYYRDKLIETPTYLAKMKEVEDIVETLKLSDLYYD